MGRVRVRVRVRVRFRVRVDQRALALACRGTPEPKSQKMTKPACASYGTPGSTEVGSVLDGGST